jgi:signal transduction histidine kinase
MPFSTGISILIIVLLILYIVILQMQLRSINKQLDRRLQERTRQPISLELVNRELNKLVSKINKCLKAEESLRLSSIQEEKRFKEMIANISHDLRTPLTAIRGYQQMINNGELPADQRKRLQVARKHTEELGSLIEHFFEYSYLINAEPEMKLERINLSNLVTECLIAAIPVLEENHMEVHMEESPAIFILADKEMVIRIVQNLIRNCIQHSKGDIEVQLVAQESIAISFRNPVSSSIDIEVEQLFDRFYTGDRSRGSSTGLGLSIVKLLAEKQGGSVGAHLQDGILEIQVMLPVCD